MHEISVVSNMLDIIHENASENNIKTITKVVVDIGEFTCIEESSFRFSFETMKIGTICENANLIINKIKPSAKCFNCNEVFNITYTNKLCPNCNTFSSNIITGYELLVNSIEGELNEGNKY